MIALAAARLSYVGRLRRPRSESPYGRFSPLRGAGKAGVQNANAFCCPSFAEPNPASIAKMKKGPVKGPFFHFGSGGRI